MLNNALNNDIILAELGKTMGFKPVGKRLCYMGHILNLFAESYIFGQDILTFKENYKKALPGERWKLWR